MSRFLVGRQVTVLYGCVGVVMVLYMLVLFSLWGERKPGDSVRVD